MRRSRPLMVTILATVMMFGSTLVVVHRLRSLQFIPESDLGLPLNEVFVNIRLLSVTSQVTLAAVPLLLGIGLWAMNSWARVLSICYFGSLFLPSLLVLGNVLADPQWSGEVNALVTVGSGLFLGILLHPSLGQSFARRSPVSDP